MNYDMRRYPRTKHVRGSRFQHGDHDLEAVDLGEIRRGMTPDQYFVIEEKIDGANSGISFPDSTLHLQSRGHYLTGGPREKHFNMLKQWSACHEEALFCVAGTRYIIYGEWMAAKHTIFYDDLPHYFLEFDIYDTQDDVFLSTRARRALIEDAGAGCIVHSVRVLCEGVVDTVEDLRKMIVPSHFKTSRWREELCHAAFAAGVDDATALRHTDPSDLMEGLYIKVETHDHTVGRYKFVRESFTSAILDQETHWLDRPIIKNGLADGAFVDMFAQE